MERKFQWRRSKAVKIISVTENDFSLILNLGAIANQFDSSYPKLVLYFDKDLLFSITKTENRESRTTELCSEMNAKRKQSLISKIDSH